MSHPYDDSAMPDQHREAPDTGSVDEREVPRARLTRQEQLEGLADRGVDTLEEYRSER